MRITHWIACLALVVSAAAQDRSLLTPAELEGDWKISRQFTLDVAAAMPAEFYDFKPNPEEMSFGQQMQHIAGSQVYRFWQISGVKPPSGLEANLKKTDKTSVEHTLAQSFDYVLEALPKITPEMLQKTFKVDWKGRPEVNGRQMMMNMFVHTAHHRAQCEVYLRIKGIKPPTYTF